jgi:hypothetical protein
VVSAQASAELYYVAPAPGDFRQGDIYRDVLHIMLSLPGFQVLRTREAPGGRTQVFLHTETNPPRDGFRWESKERVEAEGQLALGIVLTHDCEIENPDSRHHRLVGLVRPLDRLDARDQEIIVQNRHYGRLYLPAWADVGLSESYLDLRRITTLRRDALPDDHRIASMTDLGREILQAAIIRYLTEMYRGQDFGQ